MAARNQRRGFFHPFSNDTFLSAVLLVVLAVVVRAQSSTLGSQCESLRAEVGDLSDVDLDAGVLKALKSDVQILADCVPTHGVVKFSVPDLQLKRPLEIKKPITIQANGASVTCNQNRGALKIRSDGVVISDLLLEGCALNSTVGPIDVRNSNNVTLVDVQFVQNKNVGGAGCISIHQSKVKLLKVEARSNTGLQGGVLSAESDSEVMISGSNFTNNDALGMGGAVHLSNSDVRIVGATFVNNKALGEGGALISQGVKDSNLILKDVIFHGNEAEGDAKSGGAVAMLGPKLKATVRKTVFTNNSATKYGGGLAMMDGTNASIMDCDFMDNLATLGGALSVEAAAPNFGKLEVKGTLFANNSAEGNPPGLSSFGGATMLFGNGTSAAFSNATFLHNTAEDGGGAMYGVQIESITVSDSIFSGNKVVEPRKNGGNQETESENDVSAGGAIFFVEVPEISMKKCTYSGNRATLGGAVQVNAWNRSEVSVAGCSFDQNSAVGNSQGPGGGAMYLIGLGLRASISNVNFTQNRAMNELTVDNQTEAKGLELAASTVGGAIFFQDVSSFEILDSVFYGNQADFGGSVFANGHNTSRSAIKGSMFGRNRASTAGGALFLSGDGLEMSIRGSKLENNTCDKSGGGIATQVHSLLIKGTDFKGNAAHIGGAGLLLSTNTTILESTFEENSASRTGGAIDAGTVGSDKGAFKVESSVFTANEAVVKGGALNLLGDGLVCSLVGSKFRRNSVLSGTGGGVEASSTRMVTVSGCSFTDNTSNQSGGGLHLVVSTLVVDGSKFRGNFAGQRGGGLALVSTNATVSESNFTRNMSGKQGGGIYSIHLTSQTESTMSNTNVQSGLDQPAMNHRRQGNLHIKLKEVEFKHNSAANSGGGLFTIGVNVEMEGGLFRNNSAGDNGGAICLIQFQGSFPNATIDSVNFETNRAMLGGGVFVQNRDLHMSNCGFRANVARNGGGALHCEDSGLRLVQGHKDSVVAVDRSVFSGNKAGASHQRKEDVELTSIDGKGGAVLLSGLGLVSAFTGCNFSKNAAGSGGAVHLQDIRKLTLRDSNFYMGSALRGGALAILSDGDTLTASNVSFVDNAARWGGAISLRLSNGIRFAGFLEGPVSLTQAQFVSNVAARGGGAINIKQRTLECTSCLFDSNSAGVRGDEKGSGGAIRASPASNITLIDTTITGCTATQSGGGAYLEDVVFHGENVSFVSNAALRSGGGVALHFAAYVPWNCRACQIAKNEAGKGGGIALSSDEGLHRDCQTLEAFSSEQSQFLRFELLADCKGSSDASDSLWRGVHLNDTTIEKNIAKDSGSQIYLGNFKDQICCDGKCWTPKEGVSMAYKQCGFSENLAPNEKAPSSLGTLIESMLVTPSRLSSRVSGKELPPINVKTLDSFGQIAVENGTLKVEVKTPGGELFGNPVTSEGVLMSRGITVTGLFMRALPGDYNLSFELTSEDGDRVVKEQMSVNIRECIVGEISREGGLRCERCPEDFYSFDIRNDHCTPCPENKAKCSNGTLVPLDGYWHSSHLSSQVHSCLSKEACAYTDRVTVLSKMWGSGEDYPQCAKGHKGVLCGSCDASHGRSRFKCTSCQGNVASGFGIGIAMLTLAILSLIYVKSAAKYSRIVLGRKPLAAVTTSRASPGSDGQCNLGAIVLDELGPRQTPAASRDVPRRKTRGSDIFKILVNFFQVTGSAAAINVGWTEGMLAIFTAWDVLSGVADTNSFFSFECAFTSKKDGLPRSIQTSGFLILVPLMVWAALNMVHCLHALKKKKSLQEIKLWSCVAVLAVLQASYISITRVLVRIFYCVGAGPVEGLFWVQDTSVRCFEGTHAFFVGFVGAPGLLLISIGFPAWLLYKLMWKTADLANEKVVSQYGFLYQVYKKDTAGWEVVILIRKAVLVTIVVFGRTLGEDIQGNLALFVMIGSIILQMQFQPFLDPKLNNLELGSLAISTLTFIIGNLVDQPKMNDGGKVAMSIIFFGVVGIYVCYMAKQICDVAFSDLRDWMGKENPETPVPTNDLKLLISAATYRASKIKGVLMEKKTPPSTGVV